MVGIEAEKRAIRAVRKVNKSGIRTKVQFITESLMDTQMIREFPEIQWQRVLEAARPV